MRKRTGGRPTGGRGAPWWVLALGLFVILSALSATPGMSLPAVALTLVAIFGGLSVAGWLWGVDSRDGADWKPRKPGAIR